MNARFTFGLACTLLSGCQSMIAILKELSIAVWAQQWPQKQPHSCVYFQIFPMEACHQTLLAAACMPMHTMYLPMPLLFLLSLVGHIQSVFSYTRDGT